MDNTNKELVKLRLESAKCVESHYAPSDVAVALRRIRESSPASALGSKEELAALVEYVIENVTSAHRKISFFSQVYYVLYDIIVAAYKDSSECTSVIGVDAKELYNMTRRHPAIMSVIADVLYSSTV